MKCFNWKVVAALAAAAAVLYAVTPASFGALVPLLILAACPLSMVVMMRAMGSSGSRCDTRDAANEEVAALRAEVAALRTGEPAPDAGPSGSSGGQR